MSKTPPFEVVRAAEMDGSLFAGDRLDENRFLAAQVYSLSVLGEFVPEHPYLAAGSEPARYLAEGLDRSTEFGTPMTGREDESAKARLDEIFFLINALAAYGRVAGQRDLVDVAAGACRSLWERGRVGPYGAFCQELDANGHPIDADCRLGTHLNALEACSALFDETGESEWRKRWLEVALLVVARAFDPVLGCLRESFVVDGSEDAGGASEEADDCLNLQAAWFLGQTAFALEEPGFADVGRRLLDTALKASGGSPAWSRDAQAEGLAALAWFYRWRPSGALLTRLEQLWAEISGQSNEPADAVPGSEMPQPEDSYRLLRACIHAAAMLDGEPGPRNTL